VSQGSAEIAADPCGANSSPWSQPNSGRYRTYRPTSKKLPFISLDLDHLRISFVPCNDVRPQDNISVGRVCVYQEGH
jgi:hypothetical protein